MIPSNQKGVIYLIRHAQSAYNLAQHHLEQQFKDQKQIKLQQTPQYMKMKFQQQHEDCGITEQGKKQSQQCGKKMNRVKVDLVICSPLRRALSTCDIVFKNHESHPLVIVDPVFRQIFQSRCDIGSKLRLSMKQYPEFDYSLIDNVDKWYVQTMKNQQAKKQILQKLKNVSPNQLNKQSQQLMIQYLKDLWERRKADPKVKAQALSCVDVQKQKLRMLLKKYNNIAVVTHSQNIKAHTGVKPPNCSIMIYRPEDFDKPISQFKDEYL